MWKLKAKHSWINARTWIRNKRALNLTWKRVTKIYSPNGKGNERKIRLKRSSSNLTQGRLWLKFARIKEMFWDWEVKIRSKNNIRDFETVNSNQRLVGGIWIKTKWGTASSWRNDRHSLR